MPVFVLAFVCVMVRVRLRKHGLTLLRVRVLVCTYSYLSPYSCSCACFCFYWCAYTCSLSCACSCVCTCTCSSARASPCSLTRTCIHYNVRLPFVFFILLRTPFSYVYISVSFLYHHTCKTNREYRLLITTTQSWYFRLRCCCLRVYHVCLCPYMWCTCVWNLLIWGLYV